MKSLLKIVALSLLTGATAAGADTIRIITVNNQDMLNMKAISASFHRQYPQHNLEWTIQDENQVRRIQDLDIVKRPTQYDIYTLGFVRAAAWAQNRQLAPMPEQQQKQTEQESLYKVMEGFRFDGQLYAQPFYGESTATWYRQDILSRYHQSMPVNPSWEQVRDIALEIRKQSGKPSICLRGKAGWGENVALVSTMVQGNGGSWFNNDWQATTNSDIWSNTIHFYLDLLTRAGPPEPWKNGYNENLELFRKGKCAIWVDSTAAASSLSRMKDKVGMSMAPSAASGRTSNWLWSWGFAVPANSPNQKGAWDFLAWVNSDDFINALVKRYGLSAIPPGSRKSVYHRQDYLNKSPFARMTYQSIQKTDMNNPSSVPVPYRGIQFVQLEEFPQIGDYFGRMLARVLEKQVQNPSAPVDLSRELEKATHFAQATHNIASYRRNRSSRTEGTLNYE